MRITTSQLFTILSNTTQFFSVSFERRTPGINGEPVGSIRKMLCRTGMNKYKKGIISDADRAERDFKHGILTVWSVDAFNENLAKGMDHNTAAFAAWRSIDLITIRKCSLLGSLGIDTDLPPDQIIGDHNLTNQYRLAHLPRQPIAN